MNLSPNSEVPAMINVMITWHERAVPPLRPPNTHSSANFLDYRKVDSDNVVISARHPVRPSSYSSIAGKVGFSTVEEKAATLEMERRKIHMGSQRMGEDDQAILLAHFHANCTMRRQVVAVEAKAKVKVGQKAEAEAKMLKRLY